MSTADLAFEMEFGDTFLDPEAMVEVAEMEGTWKVEAAAAVPSPWEADSEEEEESGFLMRPPTCPSPVLPQESVFLSEATELDLPRDPEPSALRPSASSRTLELFSGLTILPTESHSTASSDSASDVSRSSSSLRSSSPGCFVVPCTEPRASLVVAEGEEPDVMAKTLEGLMEEMMEEMMEQVEAMAEEPTKTQAPRCLWDESPLVEDGSDTEEGSSSPMPQRHSPVIVRRLTYRPTTPNALTEAVSSMGMDISETADALAFAPPPPEKPRVASPASPASPTPRARSPMRPRRRRGGGVPEFAF